MFLAGLEKEEMVDFVCQLLEVNEIPKKLCEIIHSKSKGVPSWVEQLVKDMMYSNTIQLIAKSAIAQQNISKFEIPIINTVDYPPLVTLDSKKSMSLSSDTESVRHRGGERRVSINLSSDIESVRRERRVSINSRNSRSLNINASSIITRNR